MSHTEMLLSAKTTGVYIQDCASIMAASTLRKRLRFHLNHNGLQDSFTVDRKVTTVYVYYIA